MTEARVWEDKWLWYQNTFDQVHYTWLYRSLNSGWLCKVERAASCLRVPSNKQTFWKRHLYLPWAVGAAREPELARFTQKDVSPMVWYLHFSLVFEVQNCITAWLIPRRLVQRADWKGLFPQEIANLRQSFPPGLEASATWDGRGQGMGQELEQGVLRSP